MRRDVALLLAVVTAACAAERAPSPPTLATLASAPPPVIAPEPLVVDRHRAMAAYRDFLDVDADSPGRGEAMHRLGDLQLEEMEARRASDEPDAAGATGYGDPIVWYEEVLRVAPDGPENDVVLYQLARAYDSNGRGEAAEATLRRLVADYPDSPYADEAWFRLGELLFIRGDYGGAEAAYGRVVASPESAFHEQARYKRGWARFKQMRYEEGLDSFVAVLAGKLTGVEGGEPIAVADLGRADREVVDDTLRVVSLSLSYLTGAEALTTYLATRDPVPFADLLYERLGEFYLAKERFTDAAETFHAFVAQDPNHARAPLLQGRVIDAYQRGDFPTLALGAKEELVERYGVHREYWRRHPRKEAAEVVTLLQQHLRELASYHHARAQHSGDAAEYRQAVARYRQYLGAFPLDEAAPEITFLLGEALFDSGQYREAAAQYEEAAYGYGDHPRAAEAGYAALIAYRRGATGLDSVALTAWQGEAIASALCFADRYQTHPQAAPALAEAMEALFHRGQVADAVVAAAQLLQMGAPPELERGAWTILGHAAFDGGAYGDAERAYAQAVAGLPEGDGRRGPLIERLAAAIYRQGEERRARGDLAAAAEQFLRTARIAPGATIAATATYDAAAARLAMQEWPAAAELLAAFRRTYPHHELQPEVTRKLAVAYLESDQPLLAAAELERIAAGPDEVEVQREALRRAAEQYEKGGDDERARAVYKEYVKQFPAPVEAAVEVRQALVDLYRRRNDGPRAAFWLKKIVAADAAAGDKRTDRTRTLAAHAALDLAEPAAAAFRKVRLAAPLKKSVKAKKGALKQALKGYGAAAEYGVAEVTTRATFAIAELYRDFGRALLDSQRPQGLSAEELEEYDLLLEEQAFPFEEKAIEIHEVNARRAAGGIYDAAVQDSFARLAELLPARYAKHEKREAVVASLR